MTRSDEQVAALSQKRERAVASHSRQIGLRMGIFIIVIPSSSVELIQFSFYHLFYWCLYRSMLPPPQLFRDSEPAELRVRVRDRVRIRVRVKVFGLGLGSEPAEVKHLRRHFTMHVAST